MAKYLMFNNAGDLVARFDDAINDAIPSAAVMVSDQLFNQTIQEQDGLWRFLNGEVVKVPHPAPSQQELLTKQYEAVRHGLQAAIDAQARTFGFSGGNALILYAGFNNPFQTLAQQFANWEVEIWVEAENYWDEVIAGTSPMLTPTQAVAKIPNYPIGGA